MNTVLLNSEQHRDLRIDTRFRREYGDAVMCAQTFFPEFRSIQAHYPILFQKEANTGQFLAVALFGLEQGENLFLQNDQWDAGYVPLMIQRVPFSIGTYPEGENTEARRMVHIDLDHPKVNPDRGERLFESHGAGTEYLERVSGILEAIHHWHQLDGNFIQVLTDNNLLETVNLELAMEDGTKGQLLGFYTINEERLRDMSPDQVGGLHRQQFLEPIYMVLASLNRVRNLIERKSRLSQARTGS